VGLFCYFVPMLLSDIQDFWLAFHIECPGGDQYAFRVLEYKFSHVQHGENLIPTEVSTNL